MTPPWTWGSSAWGPPDSVSSETSDSLSLGLPSQGTRRSAANNYLLNTYSTLLKALGRAESETDQFPDLVGLWFQWRETISACTRARAHTHTHTHTREIISVKERCQEGSQDVAMRDRGVG